MNITVKQPLNFIGGEWVESTATESQNVYNPNTGEVIAQTPLGNETDVNNATEAAAAAFPAWAEMPSPKRATILFKYKAKLEAEFESLAQLLTLENGKTLDEARGDLRRGIEVVEFACGISHLTKGDTLPQIAPHIDGITLREPLGVCAGITPFNFPAMIPLWMFPLSIACGNTFILKPSEKVPLTAMRLLELLAESGLPPGVINLVQGGTEAVTSLCTHPKISAVSFVGSSKVAEHVYKLGTSHGKRVQAAGGAKNVLLVMPDAEEDSTLRAIMGSAYGCAGQRCMAGSLLMCIGDSADKWREKVSGELASFKIANTNTVKDADMGPVIDGIAQNRLLQTLDEATQKGADLAFDGRYKVPQGDGFFVGPMLIDHINQQDDFFQNELFGPVLSLSRPESLDEAIASMNTLPFGNGATIFTSSGSAARQFYREMQCGMIGINVGVPAPMAQFSFSGWNHSFFGDLHLQGTEGIMFYTRQKTVLSRWDKGYVRQQGW